MASASRAPSPCQTPAVGLGPTLIWSDLSPQRPVSNKVRFRCEAGAVSSQDTVSRRSPKCPAPSANTSHVGLPPSFSVFLARALPARPEPRKATSLTVPCLLPSPRVFPWKPLFRHLQTPHSSRSPCVSLTLAATRPVEAEVGEGSRLSPQCHLNLHTCLGA